MSIFVSSLSVDLPHPLLYIQSLPFLYYLYINSYPIFQPIKLSYITPPKAHSSCLTMTSMMLNTINLLSFTSSNIQLHHIQVAIFSSLASVASYVLKF